MRMNQYLITSAIENLTPWLGGPQFQEPPDTSGYTSSMWDAVWAPNGMWTRTLAVELLQDADEYYDLVRQPQQRTAYFYAWKANFLEIREKLLDKINNGGVPYPPFEPEQEG